jgi:hypothetical protein
MSSWAKVARSHRSVSVKRVAAEETGDDEGNYGDIPPEGSIQRKKEKKQRNKRFIYFPYLAKRAFSPVPPFFRFSTISEVRGRERER